MYSYKLQGNEAIRGIGEMQDQTGMEIDSRVFRIGGI